MRPHDPSMVEGGSGTQFDVSLVNISATFN